MGTLDRLRPLGTTWYVVVYSYMGILVWYSSIVASMGGKTRAGAIEPMMV